MRDFHQVSKRIRHGRGASELERLEQHQALLESLGGPWHESDLVNLKSFIFAVVLARLTKSSFATKHERREIANDITDSIGNQLFLAHHEALKDIVAWVFRTTSTEVAGFLGHDSHHSHRSIHELELIGAEPSTADQQHYDDRPEVEAAAAALELELRSIVHDMPPSERVVAELKLFDAPDIGYEELAAHFGLEQAAVRKRWQRARARLQRGLMHFDLRPLMSEHAQARLFR